VLAISASPALALWIGLGFIGSVLSGMFGVGVVLTMPLLLYVPPLIGREPMAIHTIAGTSTVLVATVGLAGALSHTRQRRVRWSLIPTIGGGMAPAAFAGAAASRLISPRVLLALLAVLVVAAALALILLRGKEESETGAAELRVNPALEITLGAVLGFFVGMVGAGGGFLLVPLLTYVLRVPLRVAVGSSLGILAVSGLAGMLGKALTGQVDWLFAAALVAGGLPGVRFGAWLGSRVNIRQLAFAQGLLLALLAMKMWWDILRA
jgi:uncharacterized membrane protein YfcA